MDSPLLRFADAGVEQAYRSFFLEQDKRQAFFAVGLYAALKASFAAIDLMVQATGQVEWVLLMRFAFVAASLLVMAMIPRLRRPVHYDALMFGWCMLVVASTFYTIAHRPADHFGFVSTSPLLVVLFFVFFRNRFELQLLASASLVAGDLFTTFVLRDPQPMAVLIQICVSYGVALVVGIAVSRQLKDSRRNHFATLQHERELSDALRELAYRDELTGILNRRSFLQQAGASWRWSANSVSDCVLVIDLDHFKHLNDRYGHDAGDQALVGFARVVEGIKREQDLFGRIGGEEFALLLPTTQLVEAELMAQDIVADCRSLRLANVGEHLSVSVGIARVEPGDQDLAATLRRADRALYQAKALGRGRSVTA
ncbi:GGDEF domain-containing protein [Lysobacter fragariae]